jgi:NAD(P)-dependent dehydrogenase (short-subunit alcohol dehydrogenase family)
MTGNGNGAPIAIVTGGASGIGAACARLLAQRGWGVVVADVDETKGRAVAAGIGKGADFQRLDVLDEAAWTVALDAIQRRRGPIRGLVNAAGVAHPDDTLERCTREVWDFIMGVNLDGVFLGTKHGLARLREGGGAIVNIASMYANTGDADTIAYCASKGGVWLLTRSVALHCARRKLPVRVNSVHPGYIRTPMLEPYIAANPAYETWMVARHPLGRMGRPEDVAAVVAYLLSDDARFVNGAAMTVDGGHLAD